MAKISSGLNVFVKMRMHIFENVKNSYRVPDVAKKTTQELATKPFQGVRRLA